MLIWLVEGFVVLRVHFLVDLSIPRQLFVQAISHHNMGLCEHPMSGTLIWQDLIVID